MKETKYLPFEKERLKRFKKILLKGKHGYELDGSPSESMLNFIWIKELLYSRIPKQYWTMQLQKLTITDKVKNLAQLYLDHFAAAQANGLGFIFLGSNGLGKTTTAAVLAIYLLKQGLSATYITAQTYMDFEMDFDSENKKIIVTRLKQSDIIIIDEFDKLYINQKTNYSLKKIENFLREELSLNKMIIICSNLEEQEIKESFNNSVYSLIQRQLEFVNFLGEDISKIKRKSWKSILTGKKPNLNKKVLLTDAKEFYSKNREKK